MKKTHNDGSQNSSSNKLSKNFILLLAVIFIVILLILGYSFFNYFLSQQKVDHPEEIVEIGVIDDTISPIGIKQAVSLEISRIHKKGMEDVMRKISR